MAQVPSGDRTIEDGPGTRAGPPGRGAALAAAGGLLAALASASCCVVPFVLFTLGISGAWLGGLTALAPYQPYFVAFALVFLGAGFVMDFRRSRMAVCVDGEACGRSVPNRIVRTALWAAAGLVTVALVWPYLAPLLLDI